jgi:hypothetical protein
MRPAPLVLVAVAMMLFASACGKGEPFGGVKSCTLRGCQDQFHGTVRNADGSVPPGTHVLDVTADGMTLTCTYKVPFEILPSGGTAVPQCPAGLSVGIGQDCVAETSQFDGGVSFTCMPIPNRFFETLTLTGKPAQIHVRLTVEGVVALDKNEAPTYAKTQPNGPGCDPICYQASATWSIAAAASP